MKTILLADDEVPLRTLVCTTLQDPAYRIVEATDGTSALAIAKRERLDLVILDWMLPDIDGIDIAQMLRQDPATARTPIILLTAKGQDKDQAQARPRHPCLPRQAVQPAGVTRESTGPAQAPIPENEAGHRAVRDTGPDCRHPASTGRGTWPVSAVRSRPEAPPGRRTPQEPGTRRSPRQAPHPGSAEDRLSHVYRP